MMLIKNLILLLVTLPYSYALGTEQTLLKCLGTQEELLHRNKISTQAVRFHQHLISDVVNFENLNIKPEYLKDICNYKKGLKSFLFLKTFLKYKGQIFTKRLSSRKKSELYEKILLHIQDYISLNQSSSPTPECLFIGEPAVSKFLFKILYLRDTLSAQEILNEKKLGLSVLNELENFPKKAQQCKQEATK